ncbi:hypothetical protein BAE44_0000397 [Dichanthelium oligosanthes]|uniref:At1g61320/AtMIF1 LRR domain-containing protein n=1 Tax=Dichanthelium oligosanthes TaxID=888268 RepID=A0A1E5WMI3_9POAL|nr:hypothetical protein BAE44_0000397 [Dichanthelium oligosanthes]
MLTLQFPSRLQVSRVLQHSEKFAGLKEMTLCILTYWKRRIRFVALVLKAAPLVETLKLKVQGYLRQKELNIRWPQNFTATSLRTFSIEGFGGESELVQLFFFLLRRSPVLKTLIIDTARVKYLRLGEWEIKRSEYAMRRNFAREVAQTRLAPNVPSAVKPSIM